MKILKVLRPVTRLTQRFWCFMQNPLQALVEVTRVLKPHGHLIIGIIDPEGPLGRSYEANKDNSKFYRRAKFTRSAKS